MVKKKQKRSSEGPAAQKLEDEGVKWSGRVRTMDATSISAELKQVRATIGCGLGSWPLTLARIKERCLLGELERRASLEQAVMEYEVSARDAVRRKDLECAAIATGRKPRRSNHTDGGVVEVVVKERGSNNVTKVVSPVTASHLVRAALDLCDRLMS